MRDNIYVSNYLTYLSVYLSVCLPTYLTNLSYLTYLAYLPNLPSTYLPTYLPTYPSISIYLSIYLSIVLYMHICSLCAHCFVFKVCKFFCFRRLQLWVSIVFFFMLCFTRLRWFLQACCMDLFSILGAFGFICIVMVSTVYLRVHSGLLPETTSGVAVLGRNGWLPCCHQLKKAKLSESACQGVVTPPPAPLPAVQCFLAPAVARPQNYGIKKRPCVGKLSMQAAAYREREREVCIFMYTSIYFTRIQDMRLQNSHRYMHVFRMFLCVSVYL